MSSFSETSIFFDFLKKKKIDTAGQLANVSTKKQKAMQTSFVNPFLLNVYFLDPIFVMFWAESKGNIFKKSLKNELIVMFVTSNFYYRTLIFAALMLKRVMFQICDFFLFSSCFGIQNHWVLLNVFMKFLARNGNFSYWLLVYKERKIYVLTYMQRKKNTNLLEEM